MSADLASIVDRQCQHLAGGTISLTPSITPLQLFGHGEPEVDEAATVIIRQGVSPVAMR